MEQKAQQEQAQTVMAQQILAEHNNAQMQSPHQSNGLSVVPTTEVTTTDSDEEPLPF